MVGDMTLDRFYMRERMAGFQFIELTAPSPPLSRSCSQCSSRRSSPSPSRATASMLPAPLLDLLSNSLILHNTAPYLPVASLAALLQVNSRFRELLLHSPDTFRYMDLTRCKSVGGGLAMDTAPIDRGGNNWRSQRMDEALTEDEFYSGPLLGVFNRLASLNILRNVTTLILDGLTVTADVAREIISDDRYNVRILSLREVNHLNERKLRQALRYAVRPSRAEGTPKLKGLYIFGPMDASAHRAAETPAAVFRPSTYYSGRGVMDAPGAQIGTRWNARSAAALDGDKQAAWYGRSGRVLKKSPRGASEWAEWAELLAACEGLIAFDAVLCRGPRHDPMIAMEGGAVGGGWTGYLPPAVASISLSGCEACGSSCDGPAVHGRSPQSQLPLLAPVPLHASTVKAAQRPTPVNGTTPSFIARCEDCLKARWCERCNVWWDEGCYLDPARGVQRAEDSNVKVYNGFCTRSCLMGVMMDESGEGGMWG